eukprot:6476238-Amphidinium_carterae.1
MLPDKEACLSDLSHNDLEHDVGGTGGKTEGTARVTPVVTPQSAMRCKECSAWQLGAFSAHRTKCREYSEALLHVWHTRARAPEQRVARSASALSVRVG